MVPDGADVGIYMRGALVGFCDLTAEGTACWADLRSSKNHRRFVHGPLGLSERLCMSRLAGNGAETPSHNGSEEQMFGAG